MEMYKVKNIKKFLNNQYIKYSLALISTVAIIKTGYDLSSNKVKIFLTRKKEIDF